MVENDGSRTNREAFWSYMELIQSLSSEESEEIALDFYANESNQAICTTRPNPLANQIVKQAKGKGLEVYLATNLVFSRCATMNWIRWAGLDEEDLNIITTYESCTYCEPNPKYFRKILEKFKIWLEDCLMVGNDVYEDLFARELGDKTYLVTDTMENKKNLSIETDYMGTLAELKELYDKSSLFSVRDFISNR